MRNFGKLFTIIALCWMIMILPGMTTSAATFSGFSDLPRNHWAYQTILWAQGKGIVNGLPDGTYAPDRPVTQAEFTAMIIRTFVPGTDFETDYEEIRVPSGSAWDLRDYMFAVHMNWAVSEDARSQNITRGQVAELLVGVMGYHCSVNGSIQYLLDNGLSNGKTSATISGFQAKDTLTRAEAATFIYNLYDKTIDIAPRPSQPSAECTAETQQVTDMAVGGIMMHDTEAKVLDMLGEPDLKLTSQYGFDWYVYKSDYNKYAQIGVQNGKVVGLLTNAHNWQSPDEIGPSSTYKDVVRAYGDPLEAIKKGNTLYRQSTEYDEKSVYLKGKYYLTIYYDIHDKHQIAAVQLIDKVVEEQLQGFYGKPSDKLAASYEQQIFELANVSRVLRDMPPFEWGERAATSARKHSRNMAVQQFFDHTDPAGNTHGERMKREGIVFSSAAENIAYGQQDALEVHADWMNSQTGHRDSLLGDYERLGVGVYLSEDGTPFFTQNFYNPLKLLSYNYYN